MGFTAENAVVSLDWDFTKYAGPNAKGVTPEPSYEALTKFLTSYNNLVEATKRVAIARIEKERAELKNQTAGERAAFLERWAAMTWEEGADELDRETAEAMNRAESTSLTEGFARRAAELVEELSQGSPTADQIMALPGRVRTAYFGYLTGVLGDPEAWSVVTRTSPVLRNGASSGI